MVFTGPWKHTLPTDRSKQSALLFVACTARQRQAINVKAVRIYKERMAMVGREMAWWKGSTGVTPSSRSIPSCIAIGASMLSLGSAHATQPAACD